MMNAYRFRVHVSGIDDGDFYFTKCNALSVSTDDHESRHDGPRQIPAGVTVDPVSLSYGVTGSRTLWDWLMRAADGKIDRRNVTIFVLDVDGPTPNAGWELTNAWPQSWQGFQLDDSSSQVAIDKLTFVYDALRRVR